MKWNSSTQISQKKELKSENSIKDLRDTSKLYALQMSQVTLVVKSSSGNARDTGDAGSVLGSGRSPGEGNGNLLQYSCPENPMEKGT